MIRMKFRALLLALAAGGLAGGASADDSQIYGSQLMTDQERIEYRNTLQTAKTADEREQIRLQHHERMQLRARERGVTLPDTPSARDGQGRRMGPGGGPGGMEGMGPGGGVGPGRNR